MARYRTIKPTFFTSEQIVECSTNARLLFVGLWCFCDDGGVHPASAARLKMEVFPADAFSVADVQKMIDELISKKLIETYVVDGKDFWRVTGWHHQKIDKPTYVYPKSREFGEQATNARRGLGESSPPERKGEERKGAEGSGRETSGKEWRSMGDRKANGASLPDETPVATLRSPRSSPSRRSPHSPLDVSGNGEEAPLDLSDTNWDRVIAMAETVARKVPPVTEEDRRWWLRFAVLADGPMSEHWLIDAAEAVAKAGVSRTSRQAHFMGVLKSKAVEMGFEESVFLGMAKRIEIPAAVWKSSVLEVRNAR